MSLTARLSSCRNAGQVAGQSQGLPMSEVAVELVWEPAWSPERMSEDAKMALDLGF